MQRSLGSPSADAIPQASVSLWVPRADGGWPGARCGRGGRMRPPGGRGRAQAQWVLEPAAVPAGRQRLTPGLRRHGCPRSAGADPEGPRARHVAGLFVPGALPA